MIALILMFLFLSLSLALYFVGILVVNRVDLTVQLDHKVEQYSNWVIEHGSPEQKQAARAAVQDRDLENLQALLEMDLISS